VETLGYHAKLLNHGGFRASRCIGFFLLHSLAYSNIYDKTNHLPQPTPFPLPHITRPHRPAFNNRKNKGKYKGIIISINIFVAILKTRHATGSRKRKANRYFHFILLSAATFVDSCM